MVDVVTSQNSSDVFVPASLPTRRASSVFFSERESPAPRATRISGVSAQLQLFEERAPCRSCCISDRGIRPFGVGSLASITEGLCGAKASETCYLTSVNRRRGAAGSMD